MYKPTIGLEIHAELKTRTKMFCGCANDPDIKDTNTNICPICMGHPGTLPVINKEAVQHVLRTGVALNGQLAGFSEFDRKNYFYPDIPKGYQISQYKFPLISGGELNGVKITRIHLEEDTGTSSHDKGDYSLVNYNRAGVPLMELVTEPVIKSAKEAADFARELQLTLRYLGASEANMEKGEMRVEANISVSKSEVLGLNQTGGLVGRTGLSSKPVLGTKVEVKNLNSFRAVEKAIEFEIERQTSVLEAGEKVVQETRGWDESKQKTFSQRKKEESHDYRYFPEPDLPKLQLQELSSANEKNIRSELPILPKQKRERYQKDYGIKKEDVEMYINDLQLSNFFENVVKELKDGSRQNKTASLNKMITLASNYITSDLVGLLKSGKTIIRLSPDSFAALIEMVAKNELSSRGAKDTLARLVDEGGDPRTIAKTLGVIQSQDKDALKGVIEKIINQNLKVVADYKGGKVSALQFLIGQVMKETKGGFMPEIIKETLVKTIS